MLWNLFHALAEVRLPVVSNVSLRRPHFFIWWEFLPCCLCLDVVKMDMTRMDSIEDVSRAGQPVDEDGMWKLEDGTADSSKNHKNWNSGASKSGRFITK